MATPSSPLNSLDAYTATIQNLLNYNILNDAQHQKEIDESIINLFRCLRNSDMLIELEKAVSSRNAATNCVIVPR